MISETEDDEENCGYCDGTGLQEDRNPLLEEYVDCLHFILSIGNELGFGNQNYTPHEGLHETIKSLGVQKLFIGLMSTAHELLKGQSASTYSEIVIGLTIVGELLGFTTEQIEAAYYAKNQVNHDRQDGGY